MIKKPLREISRAFLLAYLQTEGTPTPCDPNALCADDLTHENLDLLTPFARKNAIKALRARWARV